MEEDKKYMERALRLAQKGAGWTGPNPMVGAVLVRDGRIIGEGFHDHFGGPHAEVAAIDACETDPSGATMYVTLEPCSHHGKTPPCATLIAEKGITRVVIGMTDPNPLVNGQGIAILENAGIRVTTGVLEDKARLQNEVFIRYITTGEPFVVLKSAMTLDGKTATVTRESRWISGPGSRKAVHRMRHRYASVLVGVETVIHDDPMLNVRLRSKNVRHPLKVVVDSGLRIPLEAKVLANDPQLAVIAVTGRASRDRIREIERTGAQVLVCPERDGKVDLPYLLKALGAMEIDSVLIEGGGSVAFSALEAGLVDKIVTFVAPKIFGGSAAPSPVGGEGFSTIAGSVATGEMKVVKSGDDIMIECRVKK